MEYNAYYILIFPCLFLANYICNAVFASFMRPADGFISGDSRMIYSKRMHSPRSEVLCRIFFLRNYQLVCTNLVIGQIINFAFVLFYIIFSMFFTELAVKLSVTMAIIHFSVFLLISLITAIEHLIILNDAGKI